MGYTCGGKAKTGVATTTTCTSESDCNSKCCEEDATTCYNADRSTSNGGMGYTCGADKQKKSMSSSSCNNGVSSSDYTSTAKTKVSDQTGYQNTCCETTTTTTTVMTACPSSPSCPAYQEADSNVANYRTSETECCKMKATACQSLCTGSYTIQGADGCGNGGVS